MRAPRPSVSIAAVLLLGSVGCSGGATQNTATVAAGTPRAGAEAEADTPVELAPAPAPDHIAGIITLRAPARTIDTAVAWSGLGVDWRALVKSGSLAQFLPVVDLDAPIDALVTLDPAAKERPRVFAAVSLGLTSRAAALEVFEQMELPVEAVEPGIHLVQPSPKTTCLVAAALGKAKARLICGQDRQSVDLLAPYLARGNPSSTTGTADVHVEVRAETAWQLYGEKARFLELAIPMALGEASIGDPKFDASLREVLTGLVDQVILSLADMKDLRLDARLDTTANEMKVELGMNLRASTSWLARALADADGRRAVAPDSFWKLPGDAVSASYQAPSNPALLAPAFESLGRLFEAGLGHLGASAAVQKQWPRALVEAMGVPGPVVWASGNVPEKLRKAPPDARENLRADFGYTLVGIDDATNRFGALLEQSLRLYEDAALRKSVGARFGLELAKLPKVQSKKGPARLPESRSYELALPPEVLARILSGTPSDASKSATPNEALKNGAPIPVFVLTFREGKRTWIGLSCYSALLEERFTALLAPSEQAPTLERRAGLDRLRTERVTGGGFTTTSALRARSSLPDDAPAAGFLRALPESDVPIVSLASASAEGPSARIDMYVPAQVFRDVAQAALAQKR